MGLKIISWYTENTPYEEVINQYFIPSAQKLNLDYKVYAVKSLNNWKDNTNLKPEIVKRALNEFQDDILLIDADAKIYEYPTLLENLPNEFDCAFFYLSWKEFYGHAVDKKELCSGTLFFKNRDVCKELIEEWGHICKTGRYPDQKNLEIAIANNSKLKIYSLPYKYCWIHNLPNGEEPFVKRPEKIIIEHFQASRQLRNKI